MDKKFSALNRKRDLAALTAKPLDLLVIGGGVTGAGIALDAKTRGLDTAVIDMQDFAAGTSSRSTKLIHGGLRYLKQLDFKLVAEVGREREIVYRNAPHVTTPIWMLLPIYRYGTFGTWSTAVGLKLYDWLARVKPSERRQMLNRDTTLDKVPLLNKNGLKGAGYYVEYRTDDARLTLEIVKAAAAKGATALNYLKAEQPIYEEKDGRSKLVGFEVRDLLDGSLHSVYATCIVNATGPWVDQVREADRSRTGKSLFLTKGVHIVVSEERLPLTEAVYFDTPFQDGRMMFAIPRDGKTYIGTTDTEYRGDIANPDITDEDIRYILDAANSMFVGVNLTVDDVESGWAGLRPLIYEAGKDPSDISRKDEVFCSDSGLISIAGGKLTGYRKMAEKVVDLVTGRLTEETGKHYPRCSTDRVVLSGGEVPPERFADYVNEMTRIGTDLGLDEQQAARMSATYGSNVQAVFEYVRQEAESGTGDLDLEMFATLAYACNHEMVVTPADFFIRRTGRLLFDIASVHRYKDAVLAWMADRFQWTEERKAELAGELEQALTAIDPAAESRR